MNGIVQKVVILRHILSLRTNCNQRLTKGGFMTQEQEADVQRLLKNVDVTELMASFEAISRTECSFSFAIREFVITSFLRPSLICS